MIKETVQIAETIGKQEYWDEAQNNIEQISDLLGKPIEHGIKETIIALMVNGIHTSSSCEGHINEKISFPYVHIKAEGEPQYRYNSENEIVKDLLKKYHLNKMNEIFSDENAENEYYSQTNGLTETTEYVIWNEKNNQEKYKLSQLIEEYCSAVGYSKFRMRTVYPSLRLEAHENIEGETEDEKKQRVILAQEEFSKLTEFLKQRYYSN